MILVFWCLDLLWVVKCSQSMKLSLLELPRIPCFAILQVKHTFSRNLIFLEFSCYVLAAALNYSSFYFLWLCGRFLEFMIFCIFCRTMIVKKLFSSFCFGWKHQIFLLKELFKSFHCILLVSIFDIVALFCLNITFYKGPYWSYLFIQIGVFWFGGCLLFAFCPFGFKNLIFLFFPIPWRKRSSSLFQVHCLLLNLFLLPLFA